MAEVNEVKQNFRNFIDECISNDVLVNIGVRGDGYWFTATGVPEFIQKDTVNNELTLEAQGDRFMLDVENINNFTIDYDEFDEEYTITSDNITIYITPLYGA